MRAFAALRRDMRGSLPADALSWLPVLMALHRNPEGLRIGQLADALHVDASVASRQFARLEGSGHARREADPDDGRAHILLLTEAGAAQLHSSLDSIASHLAETLEGWTDEDVGTLTEGLLRLSHSIEAAAGRPSPHLDLASPFHTSHHGVST